MSPNDKFKTLADIKKSKMDEIIDMFTNMQNHINNIQTGFDNLKKEHDDLRQKHDDLRQKHDDLNSDYQKSKYRIYNLELHSYIMECIKRLVGKFLNKTIINCIDIPEYLKNTKSKWEEYGIDINVLNIIRNKRNNMFHPPLSKEILKNLIEDINKYSEKDKLEYKDTYIKVIELAIQEL